MSECPYLFGRQESVNCKRLSLLLAILLNHLPETLPQRLGLPTASAILRQQINIRRSALIYIKIRQKKGGRPQWNGKEIPPAPDDEAGSHTPFFTRRRNTGAYKAYATRGQGEG